MRTIAPCSNSALLIRSSTSMSVTSPISEALPTPIKQAALPAHVWHPAPLSSCFPSCSASLTASDLCGRENSSHSIALARLSIKKSPRRKSRPTPTRGNTHGFAQRLQHDHYIQHADRPKGAPSPGSSCRGSVRPELRVGACPRASR